jgi:hypothetical protein
MSSPPQRRSQRTSASATPRRSARGQNSQMQSSPAPVGPDEQLQSEATHASQRGPQATPRNARFQTTSTQSPLFFQSSPGNRAGSGAANGDEDSDGGATPKASAMNIGGMEKKQLGMSMAKMYRFIAHSLRLQLQPWSSPQCAEQHSRQQQQCPLCSRLRVCGPQPT